MQLLRSKKDFQLATTEILAPYTSHLVFATHDNNLSPPLMVIISKEKQDTTNSVTWKMTVHYSYIHIGCRNTLCLIGYAYTLNNNNHAKAIYIIEHHT